MLGWPRTFLAVPKMCPLEPGGFTGNLDIICQIMLMVDTNVCNALMGWSSCRGSYLVTVRASWSQFVTVILWESMEFHWVWGGMSLGRLGLIHPLSALPEATGFR